MPSNSHPVGLIICLDDVGLDDLVGPVEVMVQEGLKTFSLPVGHADTDDIIAIFGARARFGVHGEVSGAAIESNRGWCKFALANVADADVVAAAREAGVPLWVQAMTPAEVRAVLALGATGAMLFPADVVGHVMAERLRVLGLAEFVIPRGGIGAFSSTEWMKAGAPAACVDTTLLGDALRGGNLGALRDRCGSFVKVNRGVGGHI
ncbi:MAG: hypothetical protein ACTHWA_06735 [Arachnia sp.]